MLKSTISLITQAFKEWNEDEAPRLGAAVAFYSVLAIGPLLLLVISIAGLAFGTEAATGEISHQIRGLVGGTGAAAIEEVIAHSRNEEQGLIAAAIGLATLLISATGFFGELQAALNTIFDVPKAKLSIGSFLRQRVLSFAMIVAIAVLLMLSLVVSAALSATANLFGSDDSIVALQVLNIGLSLIVTTFLFALVYKYLPDAHLRWRDVWVGALITAILFAVGKSLIGLYLGNAAIGSTYGAAGSLVVLLVWIYYSVQIIFFGAEITQVYAGRHAVAPEMASEVASEAAPTPVSADLSASSSTSSAIATATAVTGSLALAAIAFFTLREKRP
ncbi:YihY/virulence factor BrkB family protein [Asticcacaulis sp. YBE204]|uniref:YihY/virulence factor BrkB family protein n=1 Tax=Asticcacaulis sp. YBE204 TaxID=1282363 RepID=UPI0003C3D709|nr:YihY/virulence factor BrkB family protein [Asticcacaulis sp. YBE204]ESQ81003.1 hypothetical protein AEYBE204_01375 [Asticcacaulis sp. YBE204]